MSKRDYIQEILAKRERITYSHFRGSIRLYELEEDFEFIKNLEPKTKIYPSLFLVGIVACLETAVRQAIKRFIDTGSPYLERLDKFKDFLKFDFNVTKALYDKHITFGEFVAHLLPVKNVENVISHFGVLLDGSFSKILSEVREFEEPDLLADAADTTEIEGKVEQPLIISDVNVLMANLQKLFTTRHIVAHESNFEVVSIEELEEFMTTARVFIDALEEIVEQTLNPNMPRFPLGVSIMEADKAEQLSEEMLETFEDLQFLMSQEIKKDKHFKDSNLPIENLKKSQEIFNQYLESEIEFEESIFTTLSSMGLRSLYANLQIKHYKKRTERLKELISWFTPAKET